MIYAIVCCSKSIIMMPKIGKFGQFFIPLHTNNILL